MEEINIQDILSLINTRKFKRANQKIEKIIEINKPYNNKNYFIGCFFIGLLHSNYDYKDRNINYAKNMLLQNINSDFSISRSYFLYSILNENKDDSILYLKSGLEKYPNDILIYGRLIELCNKIESIQYIQQIKNLDIFDSKLFKIIIEKLISLNEWIFVQYFAKMIINQGVHEMELKFFKLIYAYSRIMNNDDYDETKTMFSELVQEDTDNELKYSQYIGLIYCYISLNDLNSAILTINRIPISNVLDDFYSGPRFSIDVSLANIYKNVFTTLLNKFNANEFKSKVKTLEALNLFSTSFEEIKYGKSHINILNSYIKNNPKNSDVLKVLFDMNIQFNKHFEAFKVYMKFLDTQDSKVNIFISSSFFTYFTNDEIDETINDLNKTIKYYTKNNLFVTNIFNKLIEYLYNSNRNNKYKQITMLCDQFNLDQLARSSIAFEIATSYLRNDQESHKAEQIYLSILKDTSNASAMNNLGVILKHKSNLIEALKMFENAYEIEKNELYLKNAKEVQNKINSNNEVLSNLYNESVWVLGKLTGLNKITNHGEFKLTYKKRSDVLKVSPEKAEELFSKFLKLKYISKIESCDISTYLFNPIVSKYLHDHTNRINANKEYEVISSNINLDEVERIGLTSKLVETLDKVTNRNLKDILIRDIKECAISIVSEQNKSALILCGSIIEAILLYILEKKLIFTYDIGILSNKNSLNKDTKYMDLNELLFVCDKEKILHKENYHLMQSLRLYRNIIHPSVEIRNQILVNKDNVNIMWRALISVIEQVLD